MPFEITKILLPGKPNSSSRSRNLLLSQITASAFWRRKFKKKATPGILNKRKSEPHKLITTGNFLKNLTRRAIHPAGAQ